MNPENSVQQMVNQIKAVSSDYISDSLGIEQSEVWEDDFSCFTVDSTGIEQSFDFIRDQDIRQLQSSEKSEKKQALELHKIDITEDL